MKAHRFSIWGLLFVSLSMIGLAAAASTPDGDTPAEETVCDSLNTDDISQGLYGLCLAFCEAQDIADEDLAITEDELLALQDNAPSGSILDAYKNMKKDTDPDMPCIKVDSTCPCWTNDELLAINGEGPDGSMLVTRCFTSTDPATGLVDVATAIEDSFPQIADTRIQVSARDVQRGNNIDQRCSYSNTQVDPDFTVNLSVRTKTLSPGQAAVCLGEVITHCAMIGN
jgi:hypothetical protein